MRYDQETVFRRGIEGVAGGQFKPPQSPFEKGGSQSRVRRGCFFFNAILILILFLSQSASAKIIKSYTIKLAPVCQKNNTLTVLSASQLPYLIGRPLRQLAFYRFSEQSEAMQASLQPIVFQIDQKDEQDRFVLQPAGEKMHICRHRMN